MSDAFQIPPLPTVVLTDEFSNSFDRFLREELKSFVQEEGGYLIGRFLGKTVEIHDFYHDVRADRTVGDIKLSTEAFDKATELAQGRGDMGLAVSGTWHTHPPMFGVGYSRTDVETLFVDRMMVNSFDPSDYGMPQIHLILSGRGFDRRAAYTLCIDAELGLEKVSAALVRADELRLAPDCRFGFVFEPPKMGWRYFVLSRRALVYGLKRGQLQGFWRWCDPQGSNLGWELLFIENFIRNVQEMERQKPGVADAVPDSFVYHRLVPQAGGDMVLCEQYRFRNTRSRGRVHFRALQMVREEKPFSLMLENAHPEGQAVSCDVSTGETVAGLMAQVERKLALGSAPVLWTMLTPDEARRFQKKVKVDRFGKVYLPEDALVSEVLKQRVTPETPIYWESTELNPRLVRRLRTYRFEQMGYDVEALSKRRVLVAGVGLLGCEIAHHLGVLGVGKLALLDNGRVDWVNIYRQSLYRQCDVGSPKVEAAARVLQEMGCEVDALEWSIPSVLVADVQQASGVLARLYDLVQEADVVVGALDSFSTRAVLQVMCRVHGVPFLAASLDYVPALAMTQGSISFYHPETGRCYGCGSDIKTQIDRGACTNTPLEFPKIVGGLAAKVLVDFLNLDQEVKPLEYRIYHDYRIELKELGRGARHCVLCDMSVNVDRVGLVSRIVDWLIS
ncbi:MAG: ThiF family adenylyltransferase [Proteobacteria bacterium]|nr:ThiF family adenylyltransferase [Pseudomonadota bacterium]